MGKYKFTRTDDIYFSKVLFKPKIIPMNDVFSKYDVIYKKNSTFQEHIDSMKQSTYGTTFQHK